MCQRLAQVDVAPDVVAVSASSIEVLYHFMHNPFK